MPGRGAPAFLPGLAMVLAAIVLAGCGQGGNPAQTQQREAPVEAPPPPNPNARPVDAATAGTVSGVIKLDGAPPKMRNINMRSVPSCNQAHETPATTEDVMPGDNGTLQNVVVYLKGDFSAYSFPAAAEPVTVDQKGCTYVPHVVAV